MAHLWKKHLSRITNTDRCADTTLLIKLQTALSMCFTGIVTRYFITMNLMGMDVDFKSVIAIRVKALLAFSVLNQTIRFWIKVYRLYYTYWVTLVKACWICLLIH